MTHPAKKRRSSVPRCIRILAIPALVWHLPACGGQDAPSLPQPDPGVNEVVSCLDLHLMPPRTGATFHCTACSRQWQWQLEEPAKAVYIVVDLECLATTGARLVLLGPDETLLWEMEVRTGDKGRACLSHESAPAGRYRLRLEGSPPGRGIVSFSGSVWASIYNHRGERIAPASADTP